MLGGRVGVDDQIDAVHVDAARGDVGGDQDPDRPGSEPREVALTGTLGEVSVQFGSGNVGGGQLAGELARAVLGPGEDQRPVAAFGEGRDNGYPVGGHHGEQVVDDRCGSPGRVDGVLGRIVEEPADEDIHGVVEGRGEQHPLPVRRGRVQQPAHDRQEAEVGHVVGFVHHADLDVAEVAVALADQVGQPARAGDDDVHPAAQRCHLRPLRRAAENRGDLQASGPGERAQHILDLAGQFAGRHEHQPAGAAGHGVPGGQPGGQRDAEPQCLAGAGLAAAEDVGTGQGIGHDGGLDGERHVDARGGQRRDQWLGHAERGKGGAVRGVHRTPAAGFPAQARSTFDELSCHECRSFRT